MNLIYFADKFPDEENCQLKFIELRERESVKYRKFVHENHYWKHDEKWMSIRNAGHVCL